ncbi:MAG: PH domain-containing protein, partial [Ilumatobacter fluminis]
WSLAVFALVPVNAVVEDRRWRRRRWGLHADGVGESYGLVWRHTGELPLHKAQVVTVRQSFFERRRGLATLHISTAGGSFRVPFIDLADADAARDRVLHRAEIDRRPVL